MKKKESLRNLQALLLGLLLVIAVFPVQLLAEELPASTNLVEAESFAAPITYIIVNTGTELADIPFPATLTATLVGGATAEVAVAWQDTDAYNMNLPGSYSFSATLDAGYTYAGQPPTAIVTVETTAESTSSTESVEDAQEAAATLQAEGTIAGIVWCDTNSNGIMDSEEQGIEGYPVDLYQSGTLLESTVTGTGGSYTFTVAPGEYTVAVAMQTINGIEYLLPMKSLQAGTDNTFDVDATAEPIRAVSEPITISDADHVASINAGMRQIAGNRRSSTIVGGGTGIIVTTEAEFRTALADATYTTIYLGADITMSSNFTGIVARSNGLVIDGYDPTDTTQTRHVYTSNTLSNSFQGAETNITFRNMEVLIRNYYGIYRPTSTSVAFTVTLDNVTGHAAQYFYGNARNGNLVVRDCELYLEYSTATSRQQGEFAERANTVTFEGTVVVNRPSGTYSFFWYCNTIAIADSADVTLNIGSTPIYTMFFNVNTFTVGENAKFAGYTVSNSGFSSPTLESIALGQGADVKLIYTGTSNVGSNYLSSTSFTMASDASFLLYAPSSTAALDAPTITLTNPKQFIVLNPNARAIYNSATTLNATSIESIGYFYQDKISSVYNSTSYEYVGSEVDYSKWWKQNQDFHVTASAWQGTSPTISTDYTSANVTGYPATAPAPQTTLAQSNFGTGLSGQIAYGVVIKRANATYSDVTITKTTQGRFADLTKLFTFTIYLMDSTGNAITTSPTLACTGTAISGVAAPAYTSLTFDSTGAASFTLSHGQSLTLEGVDTSQIEVAEAASEYTVSISDGDTLNVQANGTGALTLNGDMQLTFTNTRVVAVPTGISASNKAMLQSIVIVIIAAVALYALGFLYRRKQKGEWDE